MSIGFAASRQFRATGSARETPTAETALTPASLGAAVTTTGATDEALLRMSALGSSEAFRELARRYQTPIYRYLVRMTPSEQDAEDAAIEVFVRAWRHAPRFEYRAKVSTWLFRIASNIARDAHDYRRIRPREVSVDCADREQMSTESAEEHVLESIQRDSAARLIRESMLALNSADRSLIVLYYLEEKSYPEIEAILGVSNTILKTRLARARQRLRTHLSKLGSTHLF